MRRTLDCPGRHPARLVHRPRPSRQLGSAGRGRGHGVRRGSLPQPQNPLLHYPRRAGRHRSDARLRAWPAPLDTASADSVTVGRPARTRHSGTPARVAAARTPRPSCSAPSATAVAIALDEDDRTPRDLNIVSAAAAPLRPKSSAWSSVPSPGPTQVSLARSATTMSARCGSTAPAFPRRPVRPRHPTCSASVKHQPPGCGAPPGSRRRGNSFGPRPGRPLRWPLCGWW